MSSERVEAGRDADVLIAESVMGWTVNRADGRHWHTVGPVPRGSRQVGGDCCAGQQYDVDAFMPSTRRESALEVVDRLIAADMDLVIGTDFGDNRQWQVEVFARTDTGPEEVANYTAPTLALAICRAALSEGVLSYLAAPPAPPAPPQSR